MKKFISVLAVLAVAAAALTGCKGNSGTNAGGFDETNSITVVTREEGSGTRDAFVELTGVLTKDEAGNKTDNTTKEANVIDGTQAVMSTVAGDSYAIGYISLGSLNDTVKALSVNGVAPSADTIKDGSYVIARPFNIAVKEDVNATAKDFIEFILSEEGQKIIEDNGYVKLDDAKPYAGTKPAGKIRIGGSSSVSPVMEKLKEAYSAINPDAKIEIQTTDSTSGMTGAKDGTLDIGMASRDLKPEEAEALKGTKIAMDGIAVIVNLENPVNDMSTDTIKNIYTGAATEWANAK